MTGLLQAVVSGALTGLVYGIVALSFVVIYRASRIVNLAQGQLVLIGAFFVWTFVQQLGLPPAVGLPLAILASMAAGALTERLVFRQLIGQSTFAMVMASIGLLILLQGLTQIVWGAETRSFPRIFPDGAIKLGEVYVNKALLIGAADLYPSDKGSFDLASKRLKPAPPVAANGADDGPDEKTDSPKAADSKP
jgi:branched-chain amino acid transport system permease protein